MKTNNQPKLKNKIFIIWGLFISGVILVFLIILLLAINKPQPKIETINQQHLKSKTNPQQEQETYNAIMNKIEKEIDELTKPKQEPVSNVETNKQQEQETHNAIMNKIEKEIDELTKPSKKNTEEILVKEIKELKNQRLTLSALYFSVGRTGNLEKQKEVIQKMDKIDKLIEEKNQKIILIEQDKEEIKSAEKSDPVAPRQRG